MSKNLPAIQNLNRDETRLAAMLKALGNPIRFGMMQYMAENRMCITGDIVAFTSLAQSTVSQHLKVLREAGLIEGEIEGPAVCYCISAEGLRFLKTQIDKWLPDCCNPVASTSQENCC